MTGYHLVRPFGASAYFVQKKEMRRSWATEGPSPSGWPIVPMRPIVDSLQLVRSPRHSFC